MNGNDSCVYVQHRTDSGATTAPATSSAPVAHRRLSITNTRRRRRRGKKSTAGATSRSANNRIYCNSARARGCQPGQWRVPPVRDDGRSAAPSSQVGLWAAGHGEPSHQLVVSPTIITRGCAPPQRTSATNAGGFATRCFSATPSCAGGVTISVVATLSARHNWMPSNLSTARRWRGALGLKRQRRDLHTTSVQPDTNPTLPTNAVASGIIGATARVRCRPMAMSGALPAIRLPRRPSVTGTGNLLIYSNLIHGNRARALAAVVCAFRQLNGTEATTFP